jgi:hypothetical protein
MAPQTHGPTTRNRSASIRSISTAASDWDLEMLEPLSLQQSPFEEIVWPQGQEPELPTHQAFSSPPISSNPEQTSTQTNPSLHSSKEPPISQVKNARFNSHKPTIEVYNVATYRTASELASTATKPLETPNITKVDPRAQKPFQHPALPSFIQILKEQQHAYSQPLYGQEEIETFNRQWDAILTARQSANNVLNLQHPQHANSQPLNEQQHTPPRQPRIGYPHR